MITYNITIKIDPTIEEEWLTWMKEKHIPDVLNTGHFINHNIYKLLGQDESEGNTFIIQYHCNTMEEYEGYQKEFATKLQLEHSNRYGNSFVAFRSLLKSL